MEKSNTKSLDTSKAYLVVSILLSASAFLYFKGTEPWFLLALFSFNGLTMAFFDKKALETGKIFFWGLGMKGLKTFVLFVSLGSICYFKAVDNVVGFAAFFCLGFFALMTLEVLHLKKEFGKL
jgi:hypothetical protein